MRRHPGWVLPLPDFAQQIEVMDIESQKAGVLRTLSGWLVLGAGDHSMPLTFLNGLQISSDSSADAIL